MRQHRGSIALARELRRLAAIVAADVVGYSRLMGRDESGTLAALKAVRRELIDPKIAEHGGRLVKTNCRAQWLVATRPSPRIVGSSCASA